MTAAQDRQAVMADWPALASRVGPLVLCRRVGSRPVYTHITPGWELKLTGVLTAGQLAALAGLPPIEATRESAIEAHLACARLFLPYARELAGRAGAPWPGDLEAAARRHLHDTLAVTF